MGTWGRLADRFREARRGLRGSRVVAVLVTSALFALTLCSVAPAADRWTDIADARWVSDYGVTAADVATVADGYPDNMFRPYLSVKRGQFAKMAVNGLDVDTKNPSVPTFKDVPRSHIFYIHIEGAAEADLVGGYADGSFGPDDLVTRQQANSILARYLSGVEISTSGSIRGVVRTYPTLAAWYTAEGIFYLGAYSDQGGVLEQHRPGTAYLVYREVVKGSGGKLNPGSPLSRAQAAVLVLRTEEAVGAVTTPPAAPTGLLTMPASPSPDARPFVTGKTIPNGRVAVYDTFSSATVEVGQVTADSEGNFSVRVAALLEGSHSFTAKVKDALGLISSSSAPVAYVYDATGPTGDITVPAADSAVRTRKPIFSATALDPGSGVSSVAFQYRAAGSTGSFTTINFDTVPQLGVYGAEWGDILLPDGSFEFRVVITDMAGNLATVGPISVIVDLQIPTVELQAPLADGIFFTTSRSPLFAAAAADLPAGAGVTPSGVAHVEFLYQTFASLPAAPGDWENTDFTLLSSDDSPGYSADWAAVLLADGRYVFAVQSVDGAGNRSALDWQDVVVDSAAPVVAVTAPVTGGRVAGGSPYTITWTATDAYFGTDPIKIEYSANAGDTWTTIVAATANDGSYEWAVPGGDVDVETFRVRVTATDGMARSTSASTGNFTVDNTDPDAPINVMAADEDGTFLGIDGRDFTVVWEASASDDVAKQYIYILPRTEPPTVLLTALGVVPVVTIPGNSTVTWTGPSSLTTDSAGDPFSFEMDYHVWVVAEDAAGRRSASAPALWPESLPVAPVLLTAVDGDSANAGVDGRDFTLTWTPSTSTDVLEQRIYILPTGTTLVPLGVSAHTPAATLLGNEGTTWTGTSTLTVDGTGSAFVAGEEYDVWVVAADDDTRVRPSDPMTLTVTAP